MLACVRAVLWVPCALAAATGCGRRSEDARDDLASGVAAPSAPSAFLLRSVLPPEAIRFPAVSAGKRATFEEAVRLHLEAIARHRAKDPEGRDEAALRALALYAEAGALVADLESLEHEVVVSLAAAHRFAEAIDATRRWLGRFPADRPHRETLAKLCFQARRFPEAARELDALLETTPEEARLLRMRADVALEMGDRDAAVRAADRLAALAASDLASARAAARAFAHFDDFERALPLLERVRAADPNDAEARLELGRALNACERHEEALRALEPLGGDPRFAARALLESARALGPAGRHGEAVEVLDRLLEREPWSPSAYHLLAASLRRLGRDEEAQVWERARRGLEASQSEGAKAFAEASAGRPGAAATHRARSLLLAGRFREAEAALREPHLERDPEARLSLASLYLDWMRAREAAEILDGLAGAFRSAPPLAAEVSRLSAAARAMLESRDELRRRIAASRWQESVALRLELAAVLAATDRTEAVFTARSAAAAEPSNAAAWRALAALLDAPEERYWRRYASAQARAATASARGDRFADAAAGAGIDFRHERGAAGRRHLYETMGGGAAWLDYDRDGDPDLYLTSGQRPLADGSFPRRGANRLYRNDGSRFTDVTDEAKVPGRGYGLGAAVGDIDNDGFPDLYAVSFGPNLLYHNRGDGTFEEFDGPATAREEPFSGGAALADFDGDGLCDLFVTAYVRYDPAAAPRCGETAPDGRRVPVVCGPIAHIGARSSLYRNLDGRRFEDATERSGIGRGTDARAKALAPLAADLDADGDVDLFVACDTTANLLYRNRGDGTFEEVGLESGVAASDAGAYEGGMGIAIGDVWSARAAGLEGDGLPDLVVTNFDGETNRLYAALAGGGFVDATAQSGIALGSRPYVGWGTAFFDFDADGVLELFVANGHIYDNAEEWLPERAYRQRCFLYTRGRGEGSEARYEESGAAWGEVFAERAAFRGAAFADYDRDGGVDVLVMALDERPRLLRNAGPRGHWLAVELAGDGDRPGGRDAVGARVEVETASGRHVRWRAAGGSYLSESEPRLHFGLGGDPRVHRLTVEWPGGGRTVLEDLAADQTVVVERRGAR